MKLNNGLFEIGGEQIGIGVPVLTIEHTDLSVIDASMTGMGCPNFLMPALMQETTTVDLPFEDDGVYRIVDTNGLMSITGYIFVQSVSMQGMEGKIIFAFSILNGMIMAEATKAEDGKWTVAARV
jgi:hypothetical protein